MSQCYNCRFWDEHKGTEWGNCTNRDTSPEEITHAAYFNKSTGAIVTWYLSYCPNFESDHAPNACPAATSKQFSNG